MNNLPFKHGKLWSHDDDKNLIKYVKNNNDISKIANDMYRTEDSIKYRIISKIIYPKFDFINCNNTELYKKYHYISKENIDRSMYKTKKHLILYYLNQMSQLIIKTDSESIISEYIDKIKRLVDN
tara:strand:- start:1811 stop:2185 length:375 start_codon:yes stop_codon:yes gene_type:complete